MRPQHHRSPAATLGARPGVAYATALYAQPAAYNQSVARVRQLGLACLAYIRYLDQGPISVPTSAPVSRSALCLRRTLAGLRSPLGPR